MPTTCIHAKIVSFLVSTGRSVKEEVVCIDCRKVISSTPVIVRTEGASTAGITTERK